ncbi:MAG: sulfotransferase [Haliea sp.]
MDSVKIPDPLCAIICGFEKSGTTLLNEILRQHPNLDSGHEVGVLLGESPRNFRTKQPYYAFFKKSWRLDSEQLEFICDTEDWGEFYRRARNISPLIADKTTKIFDKTPIYMLYLNDVMSRVPSLPCVVNVRDPRALMYSWANWSGHAENPERWLEENFESNCNRFLSYARGYENALGTHSARIYLNQFEKLCFSPQEELRKIFDFLGFEFNASFLNFESEHFVYGNTVSEDYVFAYRQRLSDRICQRILKATSKFEQWHFHR